MVGKKGFTLIELLIVVTILSVLAGAAVPYVQDYLEDSRVARVKTDLEEIKSALQRYELTRGIPYAGGDVASLVGPFLSKALVDPWGAPYVIATNASVVRSKGPDGSTGGSASGDDVTAEFRPRMAVTQVLWIDTNQDGVVNTGDCLNLKCTRPINGGPTAAYAADFAITGTTAPTSPMSSVGKVQNNRVASYTLVMGTSNGFTPGSDTIRIISGTALTDFSGVTALQDVLTIQSR